MSPVEPRGALGKVQRTLIQVALSYPDSREDHPWDHVAIKVRGKMFLILGGTQERLTVTCKLPQSAEEALLLPFTEPTGYGYGKHGWVSAHFDKGEEAPVSILMDWIEESFRAVAPKTVVKQLDAEEAPVRKKSMKKKAAKKKVVRKKVVRKKVARKKVARKTTTRRTKR